MNILESKLKVEKTARYFTNSPETVESVIFVIHGYAQLGRDFISEFEFLDDGITLIVAPEGLSKFYSRNNVGASWMTKVQREDEIRDYLMYLDTLEESLFTALKLSGIRTSVIGFSQGVHTAVRWFTESKHDHYQLILCSSDFPEDADFMKLKRRLNGNELIYIQGTEDPIVVTDTFRKSISLLASYRIPHKEILFIGKHVISKEAVCAALKK